MIMRVSWVTLMAVALLSCGDGGDAMVGQPATEEGGKAAAPETSSTAPAGPARDSFILCPALEQHRDELASIIGFEQDAERAIDGFGSECNIRGDHGAFIRVALAPSYARSISMHVGGYDSEPSPAPELGHDAVFIANGIQPHVVFPMSSLIIDVDSESIQTPSRETMIELALRVREILTAANR